MFSTFAVLSSLIIMLKFFSVRPTQSFQVQRVISAVLFNSFTSTRTGLI